MSRPRHSAWEAAHAAARAVRCAKNSTDRHRKIRKVLNRLKVALAAGNRQGWRS